LRFSAEGALKRSAALPKKREFQKIDRKIRRESVEILRVWCSWGENNPFKGPPSPNLS